MYSWTLQRHRDLPTYSGKIQTWYDCAGDDNTFFVAAAAPEDRECVVAVMAKIAPGAGEADRKEVQHIIDAVKVDCGGIEGIGDRSV